jgi:AAA domain
VSNYEITKQGETPKRMTIVLWGQAGCGKTTYSATAPGQKLWLSFGDGEHTSIEDRKDVDVMHLYRYDYADVLENRHTTNPFGLDRILKEREDIQTVVCDSLTAISDMALRRAVDLDLRTEKHKKPTMEEPGWTAYGGRNAITLALMNRLLNVTAKHGVHLIMTAHEADPEKDKAGIPQFYTIMLGGKMVTNVTWRISEFWFMSEDSKGRQIAVRPTRKRKPMKSRMFKGTGAPEFALAYDADKPDDGQMTIASFYEQWVENGSKLLVPPSRRAKGETGTED